MEPVIFFTYPNSTNVHMLVQVVDRYNFDGSYTYYSITAVNQLIKDNKIILHNYEIQSNINSKV